MVINRRCHLAILRPVANRRFLQVGWKHEKAVAELEEKRKLKSAEYFKTKKKLAAIRARAEASVPAS